MGNTQELLAKLNPQTQGDRYAEAGRRLSALETELSALESRILAGLPDEAAKARYTQLRGPRPVSAQDARAWLPADTVVLEYVLWDRTVDFAAPATSTGQSNYQERPAINSYCLALTKEGVFPVAIDHDTDYVSLVNALRRDVTGGTDPADPRMEERRNALYKALIKPVLPHLPAGVKNLLIVPDGILGHLPFDILRESAGSPDLGQSYRLSFSPSVSVSMLASAAGGREKSTPLLALGGAWYSADKTAARRGERGLAVEYPKGASEQKPRWADLPGTEAEVKELQKLVPAQGMTLLLGPEVSEARIKDMSAKGELAKHPVAHFACHGYFNAEDPARSGIVFSEVSGRISSKEDGYLTIPEIVLLNLKNRIVVLSACETGLGELRRGDGMVGLARSFMIAGTGNVGVSLWSISDEATAEFMARMYRKVLKEGQPFREAYYQVKDEFRRDPRWRHPLYWAAFVLYE
jgi:CHAT domain-containing protein